MLVKIDAIVIENMLKREFRKGGDQVFVSPFLCKGKKVTCKKLLRELEKESPLAQDVVRAVAQSWLRLWALRKGNIAELRMTQARTRKS